MALKLNNKRQPITDRTTDRSAELEGRDTSNPNQSWNENMLDNLLATMHPSIPGITSIRYVAFGADARDEEREKLLTLMDRPRLQLTGQQLAVLRELVTNSHHIMVRARAGTGKTTLINECIAWLVLLARAMGRQAPSYSALSYHQLGIEFMRDNGIEGRDIGRLIELGKSNAGGIWAMLDALGVKANTNDDQLTKARMRKMRVNLKRLLGYCKNEWREPTEGNVISMCDRYDVVLDNGTLGMTCDYLDALLRMSLDLRTWGIGFDDQLWWQAETRAELDTAPSLVFVDEYQDTNQPQAEMVRKLIVAGSRVVVVGDERQCQPPGTMVATTNGGTVPIETLFVGQEVIGYNTRKSWFTGVNTQGKEVMEIASRQYDGDLVRVRTALSNYTSRYTPTHRCLVKFTARERYCVYAMQKGDHARVGMCRLMYPSGSGIATRGRDEGADKVWILGVTHNYEEARTMEQRIGTKFGLCQMIFVNGGQATPSQEQIDDVYGWLGNNDDMIAKLKSCLAYHGREYEYPLWRKGGDTHLGVKSFVIRACNLLNDCMMVKTFDGDPRSTTWELVEVTRERYSGLVYSLKVEEGEDGRRLYVADSIVTHNSIFGFRGADTKAMDNGELLLGGTPTTTNDSANHVRGVTVLPLTQTRRCSEMVVRLTQAIVPDFECLPGTTKGALGTVDDGQLVGWLKPGDVVLCRNNADLVALAYRLLSKSIPCMIKGRDIGDKLCDLVDEVVLVNQEYDFGSALRDWYMAKRKPLLMEGDDAERRLATLQDQYDCLNILAMEGMDAGKIKNTIRFVFGDGARNGKVTLSTGHKFKGLEVETVDNRLVLLRPDRLGMAGRNDEDTMQESNVLNVMLTRAKGALYFVPYQGKKGGIVEVPRVLQSRWMELIAETMQVIESKGEQIDGLDR